MADQREDGRKKECMMEYYVCFLLRYGPLTWKYTSSITARININSGYTLQHFMSFTQLTDQHIIIFLFCWKDVCWLNFSPNF